MMPAFPALSLRRFAALSMLLVLAACDRAETPSAPASQTGTDAPMREAATSAAGPRASDEIVQGRSPSLADGVEIAWSRRGEGPVTLVFIHGWQCDASYWRHQIDAFASDYRIVTLDLAGHGASGSGREEWSMRAFGGDVAAVIDEAAGDASVVLIGHSMGGPVILEAARLSDRVAGLIAVDTLRDVGGPTAEADIEAQLAPLRADYPSVVAAFINSMFVESTPEALRSDILTGMLAGDQQIGLEMMAEYARMDYPEALGKLDVPLVVINADYVSPGIESLQTLYPRARLMPIEGTGHFPMLEAPARFNALLTDALEAVLAEANAG